MQEKVAAENLLAWGTEDPYDAWCSRFGDPSTAARRIDSDPAKVRCDFPGRSTGTASAVPLFLRQGAFKSSRLWAPWSNT